MIKSLLALAIFSLLCVAVIALPGVAPRLEARETAALAKGDRLALAGSNCTTQTWPDLAAACLHNTASDVKVLEARLVTARR